MNLSKKQLNSNNFNILIENYCWTEIYLRIEIQSTVIFSKVIKERFVHEESLLSLPVKQIYELYMKGQLGCATCTEISSHLSNYSELTSKTEWFNFANENVRNDYQEHTYQIISSRIAEQPLDDVRFHANLHHRLLDSVIQAWNGRLNGEDIIRGTGLDAVVINKSIDRLIENKLIEKTNEKCLTWIASSKSHRSFSLHGLKAIRERAFALRRRREFYEET